MGVAQACDKYEDQYGSWPRSIEQIISFKPEMVDWAKDAWGRYAIVIPYDKGLGYGEVMSYGRDGKSGGTGLDQDLIVRFPVQENVKWDEKVGEPLEKDPREKPWSKVFYEFFNLKPVP